MVPKYVDWQENTHMERFYELGCHNVVMLFPETSDHHLSYSRAGQNCNVIVIIMIVAVIFEIE
ncbi:MAG: hypothetical protein ACKPKO_64520, partial [Candidatus Fonsibacter sp.]